MYKAIREGRAVFLNPNKFEKFLSEGYYIYKVHDLEDESLDELIFSPPEKINEEERQHDNKIDNA